MTNGIGKSDLPSVKYEKILKDTLHYEAIIEIIDNEEEASKTESWRTKFFNYADEYLRKYENTESMIYRNKLCRDFTYILVDIIQNIQNSVKSAEYDLIVTTIDNFKQSLKAYDYENCSMISKDAYSGVKDKKDVDDMLVDITYVKENIKEIMSSKECNVIKEYVKEKIPIVQAFYTSEIPQLKDILSYYDFDKNYAFNDIEEQIICATNSGDTSYEDIQRPYTPYISTKQRSVLAVFSVIGILLMLLLLYKV
ncbi:PIR Superfamily Protein [Plasmodium ovale wallikeri]|uniref:PIR Superfamily Protein n=1 Tax=Plasmodium ovale wallikeri TaxID=864142 RepID=A0A1A9ASM5_PLAOA|nr:PIR Superfamily Protein [Plasmodium ovale wallikeri]SBT59124.1 PIR Superfamily Protein [Plasmodium ovale wallikeri]